jgi:hypothetical protein
VIAYQICSGLYGPWFLAWGLALYPEIVTVALYAPRANAAYRGLLHLQTPAHPYIAGR